MDVAMEKAYMKDSHKITNYPNHHRDDRGEFRRFKGPGGFRRDNRRREFRDLDEPEGERTEKVVTKPLLNFLDI